MSLQAVPACIGPLDKRRWRNRSWRQIQPGVQKIYGPLPLTRRPEPWRRRLPGCSAGAPGYRRRARAGAAAGRDAHRCPVGDARHRVEPVRFGKAGADRCGFAQCDSESRPTQVAVSSRVSADAKSRFHSGGTSGSSAKASISPCGGWAICHKGAARVGGKQEGCRAPLGAQAAETPARSHRRARSRQ
jgi:hypothetical protein